LPHSSSARSPSARSLPIPLVSRVGLRLSRWPLPPKTLAAPSEVVATIAAASDGGSWEQAGREAAVLRLEVDGRYSQHLVLTRSGEDAEYRVVLGRLDAGPHRLTITHDPTRSARGISGSSVSRVALLPIVEGDASFAGIAHAPIIHARPGSLERFSDVPLVMWHESEPTPRGIRLRYSVVFSNEDGGTPPDRLMATWGRVTDIEYVYGVELDAGGRVLAAELQGQDHQLLSFAGRREAEHALLHVVTENNMLADRGEAGVRFAPAPVPFDLAGVSREAIMDAQPWIYRVSAQEVRREGRVDAQAAPGSGRIPDPRRFVTVEACAVTEDATLGFAVGIGNAGERRWYASDAGLPHFRIARSAHQFPNGCFRGAVAIPQSTGAADLRAIRFSAFARAPAEAGRPPEKGRARLRRVNAVFLLTEQDTPGPSVLSWQGDVELLADGPPYEIPVKAEPPAPSPETR
jgi:hypothetical protein